MRLLDAFQEGLLDKPELGQRKQRLDQERQTLAARIEQMQHQQAQQAAKTQILANFAAFCEQAQVALLNPTPEVKQEVLRLLVQSIVVEDEAISIKHLIPADDNCRLLPRGNMQKPPSYNRWSDKETVQALINKISSRRAKIVDLCASTKCDILSLNWADGSSKAGSTLADSEFHSLQKRLIPSACQSMMPAIFDASCVTVLCCPCHSATVIHSCFHTRSP
jgi:hypothetical protein